MEHEFRNNDLAIRVDCQEWLSLAKLASDKDLPLMEAFQEHPIQKISRDEAAAIAETLEKLRQKLSEKVTNRTPRSDGKYLKIISLQNGIKFIESFPIGIHDKTLFWIRWLYTEVNFRVGHAELIQELIDFFNAGACELNWTILPDEDYFII